MVGKAPKAPPPPDPYATSAAQTAGNKETALYNWGLNNPEQSTPYGSQTYQYLGTDGSGAPRYRLVQQLTPLGQEQLQQEQRQDAAVNQIANGYLDKIGGAMGADYSYAGLPPAVSSQDLTQDRDNATNSILRRNQPQMDRTRAALTTQLANQGVAPGSEAWRASMDDLSRQENDFRLGAYEAGGAEQSRLFGLGQAQRQQAIQEYTAQRQQPLNEFNALRSAGQIETPQFQGYNPVSVAPTDIAGNVYKSYQGSLGVYNQKMAARNANTQAIGQIFGIGPAMLYGGGF